MHKKSIERDPSLHEVMNFIKKDLNRAITIKDFTEWTRSYPSVLTPLRMLQTHLRSQIIGPKFWTKLTEQRRGHPEMGQFDFIVQLQMRVLAQNRFFQNKGLIDARQLRILNRRGKGPDGDRRDNTTRKASILVGYFKLSRFSLVKKNNPNKVSPQLAPLSENGGDEEAFTDMKVVKDKHNQNPGDELFEEKPRRRRSSLLGLTRKPKLVLESIPQSAKKSKKNQKSKNGHADKQVHSAVATTGAAAGATADAPESVNANEGIGKQHHHSNKHVNLDGTYQSSPALSSSKHEANNFQSSPAVNSAKHAVISNQSSPAVSASQKKPSAKH